MRFNEIYFAFEIVFIVRKASKPPLRRDLHGSLQFCIAIASLAIWIGFS